ncbi:MAG: hypothetical protein ACNA8R_05015 [Nitriliruptoraceae bacterium]
MEASRKGFRPVVLMLTLALLALPALPAFAAQEEITSSGPLERIIISDDLNCQVQYTGDADFAFYPPSDEVGACGTFVVVDDILYGPDDVPAGSAASPRTAFTPVSQTGVFGSGTAAEPYWIWTVVRLGDSGFQLSQVDSYVVGQEAYRTDVGIYNGSGSRADALVYRAADCYLGDSDAGFGRYDLETGAVACVTGLEPTARIEQWFPLTAGSRYLLDGFDEVWEAVGSRQPFPNTVRGSAGAFDNGAGLSWGPVRFPVGAEVVFSHLTQFAPLGLSELTTTKTAAEPESDPGGTNAYTITITNPNVGAVTLTSVVDTLPEGFAYVPGSTTGATGTDPEVDGQELTWGFPLQIGGGGELSLTFEVTVSTVPGTYYNQVTGTAEGRTVVGTGPTAPIMVGDVVYPPAPISPPAPVAPPTPPEVLPEATPATPVPSSPSYTG